MSDPKIDEDEFARSFQLFMETMSRASSRPNGLSALGQEVADFLGVDPTSTAPIAVQFPHHQVVDVDAALESLVVQHGGRTLGVAGANRMHADSVTELLTRGSWELDIGPVSYVRIATGPDTERRVVSFGLSLIRVDDHPLAVLHRTAAPRYGRDTYTLEVLGADAATVDDFLARVRTEMGEHSLLRGQVISFQRDDFNYHDPGSALRFLTRPDVSAEQVILPDGVLERVTRHVVGIGGQRDALAAAGQHLKRGVLLYGPPGTGKTHLVRHLIGTTPGVTTVLLSGRTLSLLTDATQLARANQPALIVLEDCDLVAEERGGDTNAVLFETLEALDGLDGDADIAFILTTNRPDLLERALVERPGRVDLAVEIGKPDVRARRRLLELYGAQMALGDAVLQEAAERTEGATASFAKELIRRCVLHALGQDRTVGDDDLRAALDEMTSEAETFTRVLLGGGDPGPLDPEDF